MRTAIVTFTVLAWAASAGAQTISQRGFVEGRGFLFPETTPTDATNAVGDALLREELFLRPTGWLSLSAGIDLRANTHDQVEDEWRLDVDDRGLLRPRAALRRFTLALNWRALSVDIGKQFVSWGRSDVIHPTDRFAPRDYLNVIEPELLAVSGVRTALQLGSENVEAVWVPWLTPSRLPLIDQRWTFAPPRPFVTFVDGGARLPDGSQYGVRWRHTGSRIETAVSAFAGFNHQPDIGVTALTRPGLVLDPPVPPLEPLSPPPVRAQLTRLHPGIRMIGGDIAIPTRWFIIKGEAAYVDSRDDDTDDYSVYVVEIERQTEAWLLDVGYAGEIVGESRAAFTFAPDRQMAKSIVGRAQYTIEESTVLVEGAAKTDADGLYVKLEYSQTMGTHWRFTGTAVGIRGDEDDFIGQYRRNSHIALGLRFSF